MAWDDYRVEREWQRYEGTPLRDLYRELRERFLIRHPPSASGRILEIGPGPGRFTRLIGGTGDRVVVLELSSAMLKKIRAVSRPGGSRVELVQGDAVSPPFRVGRFQRVAMLGNVLGFAEEDATGLLTRTLRLVSPGGTILLEFAAGPGERSRYLHRLPPGAIQRLFAAPVRAVLPRVEREGFDPAREREAGEGRFRRFQATEIEGYLRSSGFQIQEVTAVAPCLGNDASRLSGVRSAPIPWQHLLELEEAVGHTPARLRGAAAILLVAVRGSRCDGAVRMTTVK